MFTFVELFFAKQKQTNDRTETKSFKYDNPTSMDK
jgi:hypothetical protein